MFLEVVMVDATYKLLDLKVPIYILLAVDGDGLSEIVALFIVAEETEPVICSAVEAFKKHNSDWEKTCVVMSDKDFNERQAFANCFPQASLLICLYHALRSFRREVTMEKMGITADERNKCLEIFTKLIYSRSSEEYDANLQSLKDTKFKAVTSYFHENWHPIRHQWVTCFKDDSFSLGETTNNRLESTNAKIKSACSKHGSLLQFFTEFFAVLGALRNERKHHHLMAMTRRPANSTSLDEDLERYSNYLTTYAFQHVQKQVQLAKQVKVKQTLPNNQFVVERSAELSVMVTPDQCGCNYGTKIGLPCRHILKVRSIQKLPLFDEALVAKRWSSSYYRESAVGRFEVLESQSQESNDITTIEEDGNKEKILSEAQKYRKALKVAQILASTACEGGMRTFNVRFAQMQKLLDSWQTSKVLCLEDISDKVAHSHVVTRPTDRKPILSDVLTKKYVQKKKMMKLISVLLL